MMRTRPDLPRMQKQAPTRAPLERPAAAPLPAAEKPAQAAKPEPAPPIAARKPQMMRQYDLIERVKAYNPATNEALLNRAYVYAMKAHGNQRRASGEAYFNASRSKWPPFLPK